MSYPTRFILLLVLAAGLILTGCSPSGSSLDEDQYNDGTGGTQAGEGEGDGLSGSGGDSGETDNPRGLASAPVSGTEFIAVEAGRDQVADPNVLLFLNGQASSTMEDITSVYWHQLKGTPVTLADPTSLNSAFIAPDISQPELLKFRLTARDAAGNTNYDTLTVRVEPHTALVRVTGAVVDESAEFVTFRILLTPAQSTDFPVDFATVSGTSVESIDFEETFGSVVFAPGETVKEVRVPLLEDSIGGNFETFSLAVSYVDGGALRTTQAAALIYEESVFGDDNSQDDLVGGEGIVRINLEWTTDDIDLDIHVIDPCGNRIYYREKVAICQGYTGQLDVDNWEEGVEEPIENIFWGTEAPLGNYTVIVDHFSGAATTYSVRVFYGSQSQTFTGDLGPGQEVTILEFDYAGN